MPFLELFDETLDINATENYELSVQISPYEVSFCILDTLRNKFVMLRSYEPGNDEPYHVSQIEAIISMDDFLTRRFRKRNIIAFSPKATLIPALLFDESKKTEYFIYNHPLYDSEEILSNKVDNQGLFIVFSLPGEYMNVIKSSFPGAEILHHTFPLICSINRNRKPAITDNIQVHIENGYLNIIVSDQNGLRLCNTFNYKTITDIQYFVMYVLRRMNISQDEIIIFSGRAQRKEDIVRGFSGYFKNIRFALPTGNYTLSYVLNENDLYKYYNIFTIVSCE